MDLLEEQQTPARGRRRLQVTLVLATLLVIPLQIGAQRVLHAEPYPAVFQPSFGGVPAAGGVVTVEEPVVEVTGADGARHELSARTFLADVRVLPAVVLRRELWSIPEGEASATAAWALREAQAALPGVRPVRLVVRWDDVRIPVDGSARTSTAVHSTVVDLSRA